MGDPAFRVVGVDRLVATLRTAESRLGAIIEDEAIGRAALEAVRPKIPARTGRLRASARVGPPGVVVSAPYAGPINYGWAARNIAPASFLEDGAQAAEPAVERALEVAAQRILDNVKGA